MAEALPEDMLALIKNPAVKSVKILFGTDGMDDAGNSLRGYTVSGSDAQGTQIARAAVRAKNLDFEGVLERTLKKENFSLTESYFDPRGGMQGDWLYERK